MNSTKFVRSGRRQITRCWVSGRCSFDCRLKNERNVAMTKSELSLVLLPVILVAACGSNPKPESDAIADSINQTDVLLTTDESTALRARQDGSIAFPELQGRWQGGCVLFDREDPDDGYEITSFTFTGNTYRSDSTVYADSNCSTVLERGLFMSASSMQTEGTVSRAPGSKDTAQGSVAFIDVHTERFLIDNVPLTEAMAGVFPAETQYDIVLLENNTIYLGNVSGSNDGTSPERRPTELDENRVYVKQ